MYITRLIWLQTELSRVPLFHAAARVCFLWQKKPPQMQPLIVSTVRLLFSPFEEHRRDPDSAADHSWKKMTTQDLFCLPSHVTLTHSDTFSSHAHGARCRTDEKSLLLWWGSRCFIVLSLEGNPPSVPVINSAMAARVYASLVLAALLLCFFLIYYSFGCLCLLSVPLVYLGRFFFSWREGTYQGKYAFIYLRRACRRTAGWKMIPGLNSSVYSIQDLLSTVSLLCWCNFLEPGQQNVL